MTFALELAEFAKKAGTRADACVGEIVANIASRLDERSPVDTGRFRANWNYGLGAPDLSTTTATAPASGGASGRIIAQIPEQASGKVHFISNSLPYAQSLEDGSSRQAPHGFLSRTVVEFQTFVDEAVAEAKRRVP
jgi:hypothetical protein